MFYCDLQLLVKNNEAATSSHCDKNGLEIFQIDEEMNLSPFNATDSGGSNHDRSNDVDVSKRRAKSGWASEESTATIDSISDENDEHDDDQENERFSDHRMDLDTSTR